MGITRLKRLLSEELSKAFNTYELQQYCRILAPNMDLYELTGFPRDCTIPRKDAAEQIVDYFFSIKKIPQFLDLFFKTSQNGFRGEVVNFSNIKAIIKEMEEIGYIYNKELKSVIKVDNNQEKRSDWGFLENNKIYNFCFVSIDICGNSKLVRKYSGKNIKQTYFNFKKIIQSAVDQRKGRIWSWEGDGGLLVFLLDDFVNSAVFTSIDILGSMPYFNATANLLNEDIKIRIGINAGEAEYKNDTATINSEALQLAKEIEKKHTEPLTISISKSTFIHTNLLIRNASIEKNINNLTVYQLRLPIRSSNCQ